MNANDRDADLVDLATTHEETIPTACDSGDLVTARSPLDHDHDRSVYCAPSRSTYSMLEKAAISGEVDTVRYLLHCYPDMVTDQRMHIAAFEGGMAVYEVFLERFPELLSYDFGHMGDPVALAALMGDLPFLSFLLSKGADATTSHFFHRPILAVIAERDCFKPDEPFPKELKAEIIDALQRHGATLDAVR